MPRYLCLQRCLPGGGSAQDADTSSTDMQPMHAKFQAWRERFQQNLVDIGGRLGAGRLETANAPDSPFFEIKELVGGYMILSAASIDEASLVARGRPGLVRPGSGFEIFEILGS